MTRAGSGTVGKGSHDHCYYKRLGVKEEHGFDGDLDGSRQRGEEDDVGKHGDMWLLGDDVGGFRSS